MRLIRLVITITYNNQNTVLLNIAMLSYSFFFSIGNITIHIKTTRKTNNRKFFKN